MKRVYGVSLGSSQRDHAAQVTMLDEAIELVRKGTDGDLERAEAVIREIDGTVDAIGLGGIDVYLYARGQRYTVRDGLRLMEAAKETPAVDGSGIKDTLERDAVRYLATQTTLLTPQTRVLMVSAVDRFGMAEAFVELGCPVVFGDLIFSAGMPYPITTLDELADIARRILPEMGKMPFTMLYPTGKEQEDHQDTGRFQEYYDEADLIAGDWHYIRKYLPARIDGKWVLTNTTTSKDIEELRRRGATHVVTTTPVMGGRSFGTNLIEAMIVALSGKRPEELGHEGYAAWLERLRLTPRIEDLGGTPA
ncbi:MAG: quinate 5-dehydrogenase [Thermaerobacter sp.]|nr:quinate 5-dehydrogenase [Thermaerobacter sp.]